MALSPEEQKALYAGAANSYDFKVQTPAPIPVNNLTSEETPIEIPPTPAPKDFTGQITSNIESLMGEVSPEEKEATDLKSQIMSSLGTLGGEKDRRTALEKEAGLPEQRRDIQNIIGQMKALQIEQVNIPLQIQEEFRGRGVTGGGVAPIQAGRLRENAIKSNQLAIRGSLIQGYVTGAESAINDALEAEFGGEKTKLETLKQLYEFNKDDLARVDKKRSEKLDILLKERERILGIQEAEKKAIYDVGKTASQFGAPTNKVQEAFNAKTKEEALAILSPYLRDPQAIQELKNAELEYKLKQADLAYKQKQTSLLGEPTATEKKAEQEALKEAKTAIPVLQDRINTIDALKNSKGLAGSVGVYGISRFTPFTIDKSERRNFIAGVEQLIDQKTLQTLIDLKKAGGTLGALSDTERIMLRNAASKIASWALKDEAGKVYGYEIGEDEFKVELDTIKTLSQRALNEASGTLVGPEDDAFIDSVVNNALQPVFNPAF